jgi:endogenous inhibitor of DNA gyrase (YacG/DUF329 family)
LCQRHPVDPEWRPFCSERCQLQDLARWADGTYRAAAEPIEPHEDQPVEQHEDEDEEEDG